MPYTVYKSDGTPVVIEDNVIDTSYYNPNENGTGIGVGLQLVGRNTVDYGIPIAQNFLQMIENFANPNVPLDTTTVQGQLWYNTTNNVLYVKVNNNTSGGIVNWQSIAFSSGSVSNLAGGAPGSLPYQSNTSVTSFLPAGGPNEVLTGGPTAPAWSNAPGISGINFTGIPNSALVNSTITITPGTGIAVGAGGFVSLG